SAADCWPVSRARTTSALNCGVNVRRARRGMLQRPPPGPVLHSVLVSREGRTTPVCFFHFSMDDDQGHHTWVAEPAVTEDGPRLLMHEAPHCGKLDAAALDEIVAQVDRWYDAFFSQIAVRAS